MSSLFFHTLYPNSDILNSFSSSFKKKKKKNRLVVTSESGVPFVVGWSTD